MSNNTIPTKDDKVKSHKFQTTKTQKSEQKQSFEKYWSTNLLKMSFEKGNAFQAPLRVNPKNYTQVYACHPDGGTDVFIDGGGAFNDRNRAMNGDIVAVHLYDRSLWKVSVATLRRMVKDCVGGDDAGDDDIQPLSQFEKDENYSTQVREMIAGTGDNNPVRESCVIRTGRVVAIIKRKHPCVATGHLKYQNKNIKCGFFVPTDSRVPRLRVPFRDCPEGFKDRPELFENTIFTAKIDQWVETSQYPKGRLLQNLGRDGEIEAETESILAENGISNDDFSAQVTSSLPRDWTVSDHEVKGRLDLRDRCVFTIDPITARDLDDAVHCEKLDDDVYEVGVHIADVSHFVKRDTDLDQEAGRRATSVYLVQKVVPMLPRELCENLCSLRPDTDRLTVSVIWTMNSNAEILSTWFGQTVIRSCVQLAYNHAQTIIESPSVPNDPSTLPPVTHDFTPAHIHTRVHSLHMLAQKLRQESHANGALALNQAKVRFTLSPDTGLPVAYEVYEMTESHQLIQEFMLLANKSVASRILDSFPDRALLRCHPAPLQKRLEDLRLKCESLNTPIDTSSAGAIQASLDKLAGASSKHEARMKALTNICARPMRHAQYFCSGSNPSTHHYALNVPLYTHFTSPIRRYADIIVHRQLLASLESSDTPDSLAALQAQAELCNDRKTASKHASEQSTELYAALYVADAGPLMEGAVVVDVLDYSFDVYLLSLCIVKRVYLQTSQVGGTGVRMFQNIDAASESQVGTDGVRTISLTWPPDESHDQEVSQTIATFDVVTTVLKTTDKPLKWIVTVEHPLNSCPSDTT